MQTIRLAARWFGTLALLALLAIGTAGQANAATKSGTGPARVAVVVVAQPNGSVAQGGVITYTIRAVNSGESPALNLRVTLPLDAARLKLNDVSFAQQGSWVRAINADSVVIETPRLDSGDAEVTYTVRAQLLAGAAQGDTIATQATFHYGGSGLTSGSGGLTNQALVRVGASDSSSATYSLAVAPEANDAARWDFSSNVFAPNEPVTVWYQTPAGVNVETEVKGDSVVPASSTKTADNGGAFIAADDAGKVTFSFRPRGLQSGTYIMVARGAWTGFEAAGTFTIR